MVDVDPIIEESRRRILWNMYGLDNYTQRVYFELSNKAEYRDEYNKLKKEFLGLYFKESDLFNWQE